MLVERAINIILKRSCIPFTLLLLALRRQQSELIAFTSSVEVVVEVVVEVEVEVVEMELGVEVVEVEVVAVEVVVASSVIFL